MYILLYRERVTEREWQRERETEREYSTRNKLFL